MASANSDMRARPWPGAKVALISVCGVQSIPVSAALQRREYPGPLYPYLNPNAPPGLCLGNDFDTADKRRTVWIDSYGGVIADFYLQQNNYTYWEQEMYQILFPDEPSSTFDCLDQASHCDLNGKTCKVFEDLSWAGTFYVFQSLSNIHVFFDQYLLELNWLMGNLTLHIPVLAHEWGADAQPLNIFAMLGAAFGMASAATAAKPEISGLLGAMSAFSGFVASSLLRPDGGASRLGDVEANLAQMVLDACGSWRDQVNKISNAIYGAPNANPSDIPSTRQRPTQDVSHPSILVMGDGQWLLDHPTEHLASDFSAVEKQMQQALAWQLIRVLHHAYIVIDDAVTNSDDCAKDGNAVWDPDHRTRMTVGPLIPAAT
ncbi:hypothetical protein BDV96DRAFT_655150 [Lophiotrema nucula]|uniref:Uncharacterized protein n=1 Tax=Lophiotrema nucula TaxID=690887 RepID=A0A6A5YGG3_9PLEO|nr:hypothetical protein BDV96DRAFT_655150 [Lophiotrema nucula]